MDVALEPGFSSVEEDLQLRIIQTSDLPKIWPHLISLFTKGRQYWEKHYSLADIYASILSGVTQLWVAKDEAHDVKLAMLTEVRVYPQTKVLRIIYLGGSQLKRALHHLEFVELWARRQGCASVEVLGRTGWLRRLETEGYEFEAVFLTKDLSEIKEH